MIPFSVDFFFLPCTNKPLLCHLPKESITNLHVHNILVTYYSTFLFNKYYTKAISIFFKKQSITILKFYFFCIFFLFLTFFPSFMDFLFLKQTFVIFQLFSFFSILQENVKQQENFFSTCITKIIIIEIFFFKQKKKFYFHNVRTCLYNIYSLVHCTQYIKLRSYVKVQKYLHHRPLFSCFPYFCFLLIFALKRISEITKFFNIIFFIMLPVLSLNCIQQRENLSLPANSIMENETYNERIKIRKWKFYFVLRVLRAHRFFVKGFVINFYCSIRKHISEWASSALYEQLSWQRNTFILNIF